MVRAAQYQSWQLLGGCTCNRGRCEPLCWPTLSGCWLHRAAQKCCIASGEI